VIYTVESSQTLKNAVTHLYICSWAGWTGLLPHQLR